MQMHELLKNNELLKALIALFSLLLGFVCTKFWDRYFNELARPTSDLLDRLERGTIGTRGRKRLRTDALNALAQWSEVSKPPEVCAAGKPVGPKDSVVAISLNAALRSSACKFEKSFLLWFQSDAELDIDLVADISKRFEALAKKFKNSDLLIFQCAFQEDAKPQVWVFAPALTMRTVEMLDSTLVKLRSEIGNWLPRCHISLELYVPDSMGSYLAPRADSLPFSVSVSPVSQTSSETSTAPMRWAARYVQERRLMRQELEKGMILGLEESLYSVPDACLLKRLEEQDLRSLTEQLEWRTIFISGPPGSGKTDLCKVIAKHQRSRAIPCFFRKSMELEGLITATKAQSRESTLRAMLEIAASMLPNELKQSEWSEKALADELYSAIHVEERFRLLVVADNLQQYSQLLGSIRNLAERAKKWPLHFLLVSRALPPEDLVVDARVQCNLLNRAEAVQTLGSWPSRSDAEQRLRFGWVAELRSFSLYLLQSIHRNAQDTDLPSHKLVQKTIAAHLENLLDEIDIEGGDPAEALRDARLLVESGQPIEKLRVFFSGLRNKDPIQLIGQLAWHSRFQQANAVFGPATIRKWTGIGTEQMATRLLQNGKKLELFDLDGDSAVWKNTLVSDGCAALHLKELVSKLNDEDADARTRLGEMILQLVAHNSIDILSLTLDNETLLEIISIAARNPSLTGAAERLLTDQFLNELRQKSVWLDRIANEMRDLVRVSMNTLPAASRVIARLLPLSEQLMWFHKEMIQADGLGVDQEIDLAVEAILDEDEKSSYFASMDELRIAKRASTLAAARVWTDASVRPFLFRLSYLYTHRTIDFDRCIELWKIWSERWDTTSPLKVADRVLELSKGPEGPDENIAARCLAACFEKAASKSGHWPEGKRHYYWNQVQGFVSDGKSHISEELVRWVAYDIDRDLVSRDVSWAIAPNFRCAMPRNHCELLTPQDIVTRLKLNHRAMKLPSKDELLSVVGECGEPELVRDNLPTESTKSAKHSFSTTIERHHLKVVDGKSAANLVGPLATRLRWRPRIALKPPEVTLEA